MSECWEESRSGFGVTGSESNSDHMSSWISAKQMGSFLCSKNVTADENYVDEVESTGEAGLVFFNWRSVLESAHGQEGCWDCEKVKGSSWIQWSPPLKVTSVRSWTGAAEAASDRKWGPDFLNTQVYWVISVCLDSAHTLTAGEALC